MIRERNYLIEKLKEAGIKSTIHTSMKKLKLSGETHLGAVLHNGDRFERVRSKKTFTDDTGEKMARITYLLRESSFNIVISDADDLKCETILNRFLKAVGVGLEIDGNWVDIELGEAEWVEKDDSVLKANIAVQMEVTFKNMRIFEDVPVRRLQVGDIKAGGLEYGA